MKGKKNTSVAKKREVIHQATNGSSTKKDEDSVAQMQQMSIVDANLNSTFGLSSTFTESFVKEAAAANGDVDKSTSKQPSSSVTQDEYELDTSDEEDLRNTIGNVPLKWYDDYDHIGYDLDGNKIAKPSASGDGAAGGSGSNNNNNNNDELDEFLSKMENPDYWRTVVDRQTGEKVVLTDDDIDIIKRLVSAKYASKEVNEFDASTFFTQDEMQMPLSGRPEHKRSFVPSKWEKLRVGKYVHAIKMGWIKPSVKRPQAEKDADAWAPAFYDIWGAENDEDNKRKHMHHLPAPKCPLPDHAESYNPPPEYLFDAAELAKWQGQEEEDRRVNFVPKKYTSLRVVPAYDDFIKERFNRCLDMYLCPRQRKMRVQVDAQDLIPKLPKPRDLQPFPNTLSIVFTGHKATVHAIDVHPSGQWLLSAAGDKTVKCWEVATGRCMNTWRLEAKCVSCSWLPVASLCLFSVVM